MAATEAQKAEYVLRCQRIGLNPNAEPVNLVPNAAENSIKRLAILTEVMTGKAIDFDPVAASRGEKKPRPDWLRQSVGVIYI